VVGRPGAHGVDGQFERAGQRVTPTSGQIGQIYGITIRATNVAGYDTESWNVIVSGTTGIVFPVPPGSSDPFGTGLGRE